MYDMKQWKRECSYAANMPLATLMQYTNTRIRNSWVMGIMKRPDLTEIVVFDQYIKFIFGTHAFYALLEESV